MRETRMTQLCRSRFFPDGGNALEFRHSFPSIFYFLVLFFPTWLHIVPIDEFDYYLKKIELTLNPWAHLEVQNLNQSFDWIFCAYFSVTCSIFFTILKLKFFNRTCCILLWKVWKVPNNFFALKNENVALSILSGWDLLHLMCQLCHRSEVCRLKVN